MNMCRTNALANTMGKIAAVTFDFWDTLVQEYPGGSLKVARARIEGIRRVLVGCGIEHSVDELSRAYEKTGAFLELTWSKKRDMPVRDQILFLLSSVDDKLAGKLKGGEISAIERIYSDGILESPPRLLPGAKESLRAVESKGYKLGLISNTGRTPGSTLRILMAQMGILEFFDTTTFSNEIMVRKPAETAFRVTLDKLRVQPKAAVHIGDDAEKDVEGAKKVGMRAIQVVRDGAKKSSAADLHLRMLDGSVADKIDSLHLF